MESTMDNTATYTILILRTDKGYLAYAPAFPNIYGQASTARVAYARLKPLLKQHLRSLIAKSELILRDPVFQTRTIRLDLRHLREQEELR
jgi:predicted RNase H-like HicB family nuclease